MIDEGYVKFNCEWVKSEPLPSPDIVELNEWRTKLFRLGLIGVYPDGTGFGNVSIRIPLTNEFIVTGTQTGGIRELSGAHYTKVIAGDLDRNWLKCAGPVQASSESLTHLAIYQADQNVNAVVHTHHPGLWKHLLNQVPTTFPSVSYGTPEMAHEIFRLFSETGISKEKVLVMAGHEDGVITFGHDISEAATHLLKLIQ